MRSSAARFDPGDVLYGRLRPYLNKVVRPDFEGLCSAEFIVFPDTPTLRSRFLQYRLNAADFVHFASHLNAGDRPRVDFEQLGDFELDVPPPAIQDAIASRLDELFTDLDAGVAALQRAKAKLKRYRASVLKAAVEGRLTADWRESQRAVETPPTAESAPPSATPSRRSARFIQPEFAFSAGPDALPSAPGGFVVTPSGVSGEKGKGLPPAADPPLAGKPSLRAARLRQAILKRAFAGGCSK